MTCLNGLASSRVFMRLPDSRHCLNVVGIIVLDTYTYGMCEILRSSKLCDQPQPQPQPHGHGHGKYGINFILTATLVAKLLSQE